MAARQGAAAFSSGARAKAQRSFLAALAPRRSAEDLNENFADAGLGGGEVGGQHREIRQSGGARQQQLQATRQAGVVEIVFKAKPQHLGQVVIQRAGFEQVIGLLEQGLAGGAVPAPGKAA